MATALDLIKSAARKARILAPGVSWPTANANEALDELNRMLGSWSNENLLIAEETEEELTLITDQASYTIGTSGTPDFNSARPLEILEGTFIRSGNVDYPLAVRPFSVYEKISDKSTSGIPYLIALNPTYPNATLYLHYAPSDTYSLFLLSLKELTTYISTGTTVSLSQADQDAIVWNLALRLGTDYGKKIREDVVAFARKTKDAIKLRNSKRFQKPAELDTLKIMGSCGKSGSEIMATGPGY